MRWCSLMVACLLAAACGPAPSYSGSGTVERLAGETEQGLRIVLEPIQSGRVRVRLAANCEVKWPWTDEIPLESEEFEANVTPDGRFSVERSFVKDWPDGDEAHVTVAVAGRITNDETAGGVVRATLRLYNGQAGDFDGECGTSELRWSARAAAGDSVIASADLDGVRFVSALGPDIWAFSETQTLRMDPTRGSEVQRLDLGGIHAGPALGGAVVIGDVLWALDQADAGRRTLLRIDVSSGHQTRIKQEMIASMEAGHDALWVLTLGGEAAVLQRLDPRTGQQVAVGRSPVGVLVLDERRVWVVAEREGSITAFDPTTLQVVQRFPFRDRYVARVASGGSGLWVLQGDVVSHIDPGDGTETKVDVPDAADVVADDRGAWVAQPRERVVRRIENGRTTDVVDLPRPPYDIAAAADGSLWAATFGAVIGVRRGKG